MKRLITLLASALLLGCATAPADKAPSKKNAATSTAKEETVVCSDESATGSNIRRRRCERMTEELRRQRQAQVDALQRPGTANAGAPSGVR